MELVGASAAAAFLAKLSAEELILLFGRRLARLDQRTEKKDKEKSHGNEKGKEKDKKSLVRAIVDSSFVRF